MDRLGLLTLVDRAALAGYCQCWARWVEAEKFLEENGTTITARDDKGVVKWVQAVPQVGIATKMLDRMHKFASEFGFTPASRTRIGLPGPKRESADDAIERALGGDPPNPYEELLAQLGREQANRKAGDGLARS